MTRRNRIKKLVSSSIAVIVAVIVMCSSLSACFLRNMTDSCAGSNTNQPLQTPVSLDTPPANTDAPTESPSASPDETPSADPSATPEGASPAPTDSAASEQPTRPAATPDSGATPSPAVTDIPTAPVLTQPPVPATPGADGMVSIGTADKPARFTMPTELYGLSQRMCEDWFADAVFVGDSITIGWKNYNNLMLESDPAFFGQTRFICEGSYGSGHALEPISGSSMHPVYAGEQHYVWDIVKLMGARKVFILFGMNDLTIFGVDGSVDKYSQVIDHIAAENPGVQLYIISAMYMYRGSERVVLNNSNLYLYNQRLVQLCERKGCEFVNIASHLIDEDGFVPDEYSSDQYVHQTYKAYAVWAEILRSLAARHLKGLPPVVFSLPK